ncbi:hypothetical protein [Maribacter hydrothermalis]|uniref:Outer membrane lipoprotein-sorting protein n=1 Tax=Maribacter hydrothermalis TaxID=1836467 RepID=A0A1B7Z864_9FLAO|nr:hypothetical protein [Maribacter hydrothermalis]APQ19103.1 hypothetical protein BTR34_18025 [Maribacter hydrothermalis]OBR38885.1 hypothetical protein A9200_04260 [Maribacter hydrothermalis]
MIKKLFKILAVLVLLIIICFGVLYYLYNKPIPTGLAGPEADALAYRMLDALEYKKYNNTKIIEWSFRGDHTYKWDKEKFTVHVSWDDNKVILDLITPKSSIATVNGSPASYEKTQDLIADAQSYFNNDSFWLVAPYKVFDRGTERYLVDLEDGSEALLVTYTQGGDTPGDSYLWILETSGMPKSFQLWTKIIPIDGLEASWDSWIKTESGAYLPTSHSFGPMNITMGEVKGYN